VREKLSIADIQLDRSTRTVLRAGEPILLTVVEFDLLEAMIRSAGRVVTREELVKAVLGRNYAPHDRSIDTHVANLRKKLGHNVGTNERIKTIRSIGYIYLRR
jgi:two-component system response regulator CpxR